MTIFLLFTQRLCRQHITSRFLGWSEWEARNERVAIKMYKKMPASISSDFIKIVALNLISIFIPRAQICIRHDVSQPSNNSVQVITFTTSSNRKKHNTLYDDIAQRVLLSGHRNRSEGRKKGRDNAVQRRDESEWENENEITFMLRISSAEEQT